jgi:hypothetical protein
MSSYHTDHHHVSKSRAKVKPILKKLTQSEKNSLDLDRPAAEQDGGLGIYDIGSGSRSSHDVVFTHTGGRRGYHARSTSGTSQFSTTTTGSGHRTGSFVHPFQQTPRPYTPPIAASYQTSLRESEHSHHSNSPALTEDEEQLRPVFRNNNSSLNLSTSANSVAGTGIGTSTRHPIQQLPTLSITTKIPSSSRLALASSHTSLGLPLSPDLSSPLDRQRIPSPFPLRSRFPSP